MTKKHTFKLNQHAPEKNKKFAGACHPPKNKIVFIEHINNMFAYSPKEKRAKPIAEYSTLYPETSSASASGKSKGCLFVSAKAEVKKITNNGAKGTTNHKSFWKFIICCKSKDPQHKTSVNIINPIDTSYETICAVERNAPKKAYFELLDQPDSIIP